MIQNDPSKVFAFFAEFNESFGARLIIFLDIIVGHFVIQVGFGDFLTFIELHGYRVCLFQIRMSPPSPSLKRGGSGWFCQEHQEELQESLREGAPQGSTQGCLPEAGGQVSDQRRDEQQ